MTDLLDACMARYRPRVESHLKNALALHTAPLQSHAQLATLLEALAYSSLNGGKRIRALLVYLSAYCCGLDTEQALDDSADDKRTDQSTAHALDSAAAAIELVHSYSLIHDDLPAMDDDALRRGKPSCHIQFGEANAILAGDALQALAFQLLSHAPTQRADTTLAMVNSLAASAGIQGMVGGQAIDLAAVDSAPTLEQLIAMHRLKTGALIECAVDLGALCAGASPARRTQLRQYASALGLAFQIQDDIIDIEGSPAVTGKPQGADIAANKPTFPALLGLEGARDYAGEICAQSIAALQDFDQRAEPLRLLANYVISRGA